MHFIYLRRGFVPKPLFVQNKKILCKKKILFSRSSQNRGRETTFSLQEEQVSLFPQYTTNLYLKSNKLQLTFFSI